MVARPGISVEVFADTDAMVAGVADLLTQTISEAIAARGVASIVVTGGGAGTELLRLLRSYPVDWARVRLFWGDDRYVPRDDDDRNEKQAREALLDHVDIPATNVHPMPASDGAFGGDIAAAAQWYAEDLASVEPGSPTPVFDVHLLGMGGEGHINSLFPHTEAVRETERMVVGVVDSPKPPPRRITLTLPAVRRSRQVWLMVSGAGKAEAVAAGVAGADPDDWPCAGATGIEKTVWLLDSAAASKLPD